MRELKPSPRKGQPKKRKTIDRNAVTNVYKEKATETLRSNGFLTMRGRTAWRHKAQRIDVIELQFFSAGHTYKWKVPPSSFALSIGSYFLFTPALIESDITKEGQLLLPNEIDCHIRKSIERTIWQWRMKIPNIWKVNPDGDNLNEVINNAAGNLRTHGIPWFDQFDDLEMLLETLLREDGDKLIDATGGIPKRLPAFLAFELKKWTLAKKLLHELLDSGVYGEDSGTAFPIDAEIRKAIDTSNSHIKSIHNDHNIEK